MHTSTCRWLNCDKKFAQIVLLEEHIVSEHLCGILNDGRIRGSDFKCAWTNCNYPPDFSSVDLATLLRHVKYHVFIEYLIQRTHNILPFPLICERSRPPFHHLPFDYSCPCTFKTDSFFSLFGHLSHCNQDVSILMKSCLKIPCPTCLTPFVGLNDLLAHAKGVDLVNFRSGYFCLWIGCTACPNGFRSLSDFLNHIEFHLSSTSACLWIGCSAPKNLNRAHLLLHVFEITCRNNSVYALQKRPDLVRQCLEKCKDKPSSFTCHPARSKWILNHLRSPDYIGLNCQWMSCGLRYNLFFVN